SIIPWARARRRCPCGATAPRVRAAKSNRSSARSLRTARRNLVSGKRRSCGLRCTGHLTAADAGGAWNAGSGTGLVTKDSTLPNAQGTAPPVDARLGLRAKRRIARALRSFVREIEYRVLYLWSRLMGPPRVLAFHMDVNVRLLRAFGAKIGQNT